jgi:hypothetical protein
MTLGKNGQLEPDTDKIEETLSHELEAYDFGFRRALAPIGARRGI